MRRAGAAAVLLAIGAGIFLGATYIGQGSSTTGSSTPQAKQRVPAKLVAPQPRRLPREVRGVHVTMSLASLQGKLNSYLSLTAYGLNTIELDVKDENGEIGFDSADVPALARAVGAARPYYNARAAAERAHARGVYLIGRVVVFEDPLLAAARTDLAIKRSDGSIWRNNAGLGWTSPYDKRVWDYNVDVAVAAARAGFDEIQFDYVRFPSDGNLSGLVYPRERAEPKGKTIERFLAYAAKRLRPLGVRVSVDLFGLAATRDLRIGQVPRRIARHLDAIYPMVYPSHFGSGEYNFDDPGGYPGRTVANALLDFRRALKGSKTRIIPWLQDFSLGRAYSLIEVADQIAAARKQRASGFMLWNPEGLYHEEALAGPTG